MSASRYSSWYFSGSNSPVIADDELLGHRQLGRLEVGLFLGQVEVLRRADLIRPVEGREEHRVGERIERGERLAVLDHDLADRREALFGEHRLEQVEGLPADLVGLDVVGLLHELRVRVVAIGLRELLDLDRADRLERNLLKVLVCDHDVLVGRVFVALDRVGAGDDVVVDWAIRLHLDPREVLLVEHVEADLVARLRRQIELDRDRHQPELDRSLPHRSRHGVSSRAAGRT